MIVQCGNNQALMATGVQMMDCIPGHLALSLLISKPMLSRAAVEISDLKSVVAGCDL